MLDGVFSGQLDRAQSVISLTLGEITGMLSSHVAAKKVMPDTDEVGEMELEELAAASKMRTGRIEVFRKSKDSEETPYIDSDMLSVHQAFGAISVLHRKKAVIARR